MTTIRIPIRMPVGPGEPVEVGAVELDNPDLLKLLFLNETVQEHLSYAITEIASLIWEEPIAGRDFDHMPGQHAARCPCKWCNPCGCGTPIVHTRDGWRHAPGRGQLPPDCDNPHPAKEWKRA